MQLSPLRSVFLFFGVVAAAATIVFVGRNAPSSVPAPAPSSPSDIPDLPALFAAAVDDGDVVVTLAIEPVDDPSEGVGPATVAEAVLAGGAVAVDLDPGGLTPGSELPSFGYRFTPDGVAFRSVALFGDDEFHVVHGDEASSVGAADDLRRMASFGSTVRAGVVGLVDDARWEQDNRWFEQRSSGPWAAAIGTDSAAGAVVGGLLPPEALADLTIRAAADGSAAEWTMLAEAEFSGRRVRVSVTVELRSIGGANAVQLPFDGAAPADEPDDATGALLPPG